MEHKWYGSAQVSEMGVSVLYMATTTSPTDIEINELLIKLGAIKPKEPVKRSRYRTQDCVACGAEKFAREGRNGVLLCTRCRSVLDTADWNVELMVKLVEVAKS